MSPGISHPPGLMDVKETDRYVCGKHDPVFVVAWKRPPVPEAIDEVVANARRWGDEGRSPKGLLIISLARESAPPEVSHHSADKMRDHAKSLLFFAVVQGGEDSRSRMNRIGLRMVMAIAGAAGRGPASTNLFPTPEEAVAWIARTLPPEHREGFDEKALRASVASLVDRARKSQDSAGSTAGPVTQQGIRP